MEMVNTKGISSSKDAKRIKNATEKVKLIGRLWSFGCCFIKKNCEVVRGGFGMEATKFFTAFAYDNYGYREGITGESWTGWSCTLSFEISNKLWY